MEGKDAALGILLIAIVGLAGGLGYLVATQPAPCEEEDCEDCPDCPDCPECPTVPEEPEPEINEDWPSWADADNDTVILTLFNGTTEQDITLGEILAYIQKYEDTDIEKTWWEKRMEPMTITDPYTELPLMGVSLFDVMQVLDTNFAGSVECAGKPYGGYSFQDKMVLNTTGLIMKSEDREETIVALAINGTWLKDSDMYEKYGNASLISEYDTDLHVYKIQNVTVLSNFTVKVYVNGVLELVLDYANLSASGDVVTDEWGYYDSAYWYYNRSYTGLPLATIVGWTTADGLDYNLTVHSTYGVTEPHIEDADGNLYYYSYNRTDIEDHLPNNGVSMYDGNTRWYQNASGDWFYGGSLVETVNDTQRFAGDGEPMPATDKPIMLTWTQQILYEEYTHPKAGLLVNSPWDEARALGYYEGPFRLVVPGMMRYHSTHPVLTININY